MKTPWRFEAKSDSEAELFLYSEIGDSAFGDSITAQQFADDLKNLGPVQRILLRVNSAGGNVFSDISIYNQLIAHPATILGQVDGLAASISSIILMSASRIIMSQGSFLMVHNPFTSLVGDSAEFLKMGQTLAKVKDSLIAIYRRHSHLSADKLSELMNAETWFTPSEAVDAGLADEIVETGQAEMPIAASLDFSKFRRVPREIAARARKPEPSPDVYYSQFSGRTLEEIDAEHARLVLQHRLHDMKFH
jgi:ATP-dependent Clp protease, protease subunit